MYGDTLSQKIGNFIYFMPVCLACMYAVPVEPEEGIGSAGTRVTGSCETTISMLGIGPSPLEEQSVLLSALLFLSSHPWFYI